MLVSVPLSYELGAVIAGHHRTSLKSFSKAFKSMFPMVGPIVLMFVFLSTLEYYSRTDDARAFVPVFLLMIPLVSVLLDAMSGDTPWEPVALAEAYSNTLLHMLARMIYVVGGLLLLAIAVVAVVSLFLSVGDLIRQGLFSSESFSAPVLCRFLMIQGEHCIAVLATWHIISIVSLAIAWRYGQKILRKIDSLFMRL